MKVLGLFSGVGGFELGLQRAGFEIKAMCEIDPFCKQVLAKNWPDVPIYEDVRDVTGKRLKTDGITGINVITAGFPCQPASVAGKRRGTRDHRWLWPALTDVIQSIKPAWLILENVRGLITLNNGVVFEDCLLDLEAIGYDTQSFVIPACAVDARHRRDRIWIIANNKGGPDREYHAESKERQKQESGKSIGRANVADTEGNNSGRLPRREGKKDSRFTCSGQDVSNTTGERQQGSEESIKRRGKAEKNKGETNIFKSVSESGEWPTEPTVCGMVDGLSDGIYKGRVAAGVKDRANRLKALGNSVVPQIPEIIGRAIMQL